MDIPEQDKWQLKENHERRDGEWVKDGTAQLFKADKNGILDFSMSLNYETAEDKNRAELMRRSPEMLAAIHDTLEQCDIPKALYDRLNKLTEGVQ